MRPFYKKHLSDIIHMVTKSTSVEMTVEVQKFKFRQFNILLIINDYIYSVLLIL